MKPSYQRTQPKSALILVLKSLIPYSRENMMLSFKPGLFFNELEKASSYKRKTLEISLQKAYRLKLVEKDANLVRLTDAGAKIVQPFVATILPDGAKLMVIFDIPEAMAVARARFRRILKSWGFLQVQKSVWTSPYDHQSSIKEVVSELELTDYVKLYECLPL